MIYVLTIGEREVRAEIEAAGPGLYRVKLDGEEFAVSAHRTEASIYSILLGSLDEKGHVVEGGRAFEADVDVSADQVGVAIQGEHFDIGAIDERRKKLRNAAAGTSAGGGGELHSPMPGKIVKILAKEGATVKKGQGLVVIEAMKMENELACPRDGVLKSISVAEGQVVDSGALLLVISDKA